ncbi:MAG: hypothetical protein E7586_00280 [Ruminococcaceae bacterium]|nr:hypothetical protein [Oscillospiraceae bacterium]
MISKNLISALEELNFTFSDNKNINKSHAYAIYGGYLITVYESAGKKVAYFNFKFSDNEENSLKKYNVSETFSSIVEEFNVVDYSLSDDGLRVFCNGNIPTFLKLMDKCVELLSENEIRGVQYCSKCGNKFGARNPKKVTKNSENHLMCEHCALEALENSNEEPNDTQPVKKNTARGIISSIAFSIIGIALYFVAYYYISPAISKSSLSDVRYIFCALGTVVSLLSYVGYRIACKTAGRIAYIAIGANALIFTAIGQYIGIVFEFIAKNGFKVSALSNKAFWLIHLRDTIPAEVVANFTSYSSAFYKMLAISLMFALVGGAIFLLTLHDKTTVKKETAEVETIKL